MREGTRRETAAPPQNGSLSAITGAGLPCCTAGSGTPGSPHPALSGSSCHVGSGAMPGLFVDPEFPGRLSSLVGRGDTPLAALSERITWLRPQEICAAPHLFPESSRDAAGKQGALGDCWFICACATLLKSARLLHQVFPAGQCTWEDEGYTGRFTCRFWRYGRWVEVSIDDRLPCLGHKLCFSYCQDQDAFWLPLLEKAYAKLHGCYEALWAGQVADALIDLTGGLVERWSFEFAEESFREELLSRMLDLKERCAMSCSVLHSREEVGSGDLGQFHAFTITDIQHGVTKDGRSLLLFRVYNPWGRSCWEGSWGKSGDNWALMDQKESSRFLSQIQDGEFWVEKEEFFREFNEITLAFPVIERDHVQSIWTGSLLSHSQQIYGSWIKGQNAGGSRNNTSFPDNPKFWLRVREPSEVYLSLMQRPRVEIGASNDMHSNRKLREISNSTAPVAVGLHLWKVEKRRFNLQKTILTPPVAGTSSHSYDRQLHLRCELSPGYHLLVPSTFLRDTEGEFLLRVLSNGPIRLSEITSCLPVERTSEEMIPGIWETLELKGQWKKGNSAGGSRNFPSHHLNPTIPFCVPTNSQLVKVTLHQHNQENPCHAIGFHVYSVPTDKSLSPFSQEPCASCIPHSHSLEVSKICNLISGQYIVVPSTYLPDQECEFSILISTKTERKPINSEETLGQILEEISVISLMK